MHSTLGSEGVGLGQATSSGRSPKNSVKTDVINMRYLINKYQIETIDFLSIDAEGYDSQVLTGLFPMLGRTYVRYVSISMAGIICQNMDLVHGLYSVVHTNSLHQYLRHSIRIFCLRLY